MLGKPNTHTGKNQYLTPIELVLRHLQLVLWRPPRERRHEVVRGHSSCCTLEHHTAASTLAPPSSLACDVVPACGRKSFTVTRVFNLIHISKKTVHTEGRGSVHSSNTAAGGSLQNALRLLVGNEREGVNERPLPTRVACTRHFFIRSPRHLEQERE